METAVRKLTIKTLQDRIAMLKIVCNSYSMQFDDKKLDHEQKSQVARRWDAALKESRSLQSTLESLEKEEREQHAGQ
jgi:hypothetical protein